MKALILQSLLEMALAFTLNAIVFEYIQSHLKFKSSDVFCALTSCSAFLGASMKRSILKTPSAPLRALFFPGIIFFLSSRLVAFSNQFLSIAQSTAVKAAKLLPTMIISSILWRKQYSLRDWSVGALTAIGLALLLSTGDEIDVNSSFINKNSCSGGIFILFSLTLDAIGTNAQEQLLLLGSERIEVALFQMGVSSILNLGYGVLFGSLLKDIKIALSSTQILGALLTFSFLSYHCNRTYLTMIYLSGSSPTQLTLCFVKALSIIISFFLYPKALSIQQGAGMCIVFVSVLGLLFFPPSKTQIQLVQNETEEKMRTTLKLSDKSSISKRDTPPSSPLASSIKSKSLHSSKDELHSSQLPKRQHGPTLQTSEVPRIRIKIPQMSSSDFHGIITGLALPSTEDTHNDMLSPFLAQRTPIKQKLIQESEEKIYKSSSNTPIAESSEKEPILERAKMD